MCIRTSVCALVVLTTSIALLRAARQTSQSAEEPHALTVGVPIEREISGRDRHRYAIEVDPKQVVTIELEERGTDAVLEVYIRGSEDRLILEANGQWGNGHETLDVVGQEGRRYAVLVRTNYSGPVGGRYVIRRAASRPASDRDISLHESRKHRTEGLRWGRLQQLDRSLSALQRALGIAEAVLPPDDPYLAHLRMDLGGLHYKMENPAAALPLFRHSFESLTKTLGPDHEATTSAQARLGSAYREHGDYVSAERLIVDALQRQEKAVGPDHPLVASTLMGLGRLWKERGDYKGSEGAHGRVLAIFSKWYGTENHLVAMSHNNLGAVYLDQRAYERAAPHLEQALTIYERLLGPHDPELAEVVQNLGISARERKDYAAAIGYYQRALAMREKSVGMEHPIVAGTLNNLANVYGAQGDYERSLATHLRALSITEKHATEWQQPTLSLGNIARTYAALGDFANALKFQARVENAIEADMALNLAIGSERQKIAYINRIAERTERTISLHLQLQPENQEAARLALRTLLQRKGRVLDAMSNMLAAVRLHASREEQALLDRLAEATTRFARLALAGPGTSPLEDHRRTLQELEDTKEELEAEIGRRNDQFRAAFRRVTVDDVGAAVPFDAALLEFAVYRPFNPKSPSMSVAYGPRRYAVFVLRGGKAVGRDLGDAAAIDAAIEDYRSALQDPARDDVQRAARALDDRILQPIRPLLDGVTRLLISPDGRLALIPFEALVDERGRYLIDRWPVTYLSAGRDLLRMQVPRVSRTAPVVVADPLFGEPSELVVVPSAPAGAGRAAHRSVTNAADLDSMYFAPLAGTLQEARGIQAVLPDVQVLTGAKATEAALKAVQGPLLLHIATHGFFIEDAGRAKDGASSAAGVTRGVRPNAARLDNPLLRSGLALAGANTTGGAKDDGVLTALEAAHLNLWGTKLVTLSACDTGIGVVRNGDGVYGLRRSIFLAGAETLVMSLWPVSDYVTRELMTGYYKGLKRGLGRGEALRQVQLSMMKRRGREHPFYWASFIQAGEWANLQGQR